MSRPNILYYGSSPIHLIQVFLSALINYVNGSTNWNFFLGWKTGRCDYMYSDFILYYMMYWLIIGFRWVIYFFFSFLLLFNFTQFMTKTILSNSKNIPSIFCFGNNLGIQGEDKWWIRVVQTSQSPPSTRCLSNITICFPELPSYLNIHEFFKLYLCIRYFYTRRTCNFSIT